MGRVTAAIFFVYWTLSHAAGRCLSIRPAPAAAWCTSETWFRRSPPCLSDPHGEISSSATAKTTFPTYTRLRRLRIDANGLKQRARLFPFPASWLRCAGRAAGREDLVRRLVGSLEADGSKLRQTLGWEPPYGPEQALGETAAWYGSQRNGRGRSG